MFESHPGNQPIRNSLLPQGIVFIVILAFVTVCAVLRNVNLLVVVSGTMSAVLALCWRSSRRMLRHTIVERLFPEDIHAGTTVPIQWRVENMGSASIFNLRIDDQIVQLNSDSDLFANRNQARGVLMVEGVLPKDDMISSYRAMFPHRGIYRAGPAIVSAQFPFPLVSCWFRSQQQTEIFVAPPAGQLLKGWHTQLSEHDSRFENQAPRKGTNEEEFFAIRNWQTGDSLKHIHWRSTAKTGQPMVRQFETHLPETLFVAADLYADPENIANSLEPESESQICEDILSLISTLLDRWRNDRTQDLAIGIADEEATIHLAKRDGMFAERLHKRLATADGCKNTAILNLIEHWTNDVYPSNHLLVLSSRSIPEDLRDSTQSHHFSWLHCKSNTLANLYQRRQFQIPSQTAET